MQNLTFRIKRIYKKHLFSRLFCIFFIYLEPLLELILEPILGFLLEASASPKRGSKMAPNPRAKIAFFHWFYSILAEIRSQGAESASCSKKAINAVAISSDNPHNQPILCETCIDRRAHDAQVQSAETLCISILDVPRCWDREMGREMGAQDAEEHIWIKLCSKFLQDLATDVPRTIRSTFGSNCVLNSYRIWPQTCPGRSGAHLGQIVY